MPPAIDDIFVPALFYPDRLRFHKPSNWDNAIITFLPPIRPGKYRRCWRADNVWE
jgi:hypothetical protein